MTRYKSLHSNCLLLLLLLSVSVSANRFYKDNDEYFLRFIKNKQYALDPAAVAIVLYEKGTTEFNGTDYHGIILKRHIHRVVQILKNNGTGQGDVTVLARSSSDQPGEIRKIRCVTYNLENGKLTRQEIGDESIQRTKTDGLIQAKFSAPAVREGAIIDYSYDITEYLTSMLYAEWDFQDKIPKLHSEAEIIIPVQLSFVAMNQWNPPFPEVDDSRKSLEDSQLPNTYTYSEKISANDYLQQRWVHRNVPAIFEEPYMAYLENYKQKMRVQITGINLPTYTKGILDTWEKVNKELLEDFNFYKPITLRNQSVIDKANTVTEGITDPLEKARAIYRYVRGNITTSGAQHIYAFKDLDKVLRDHTGTPAETNLLLIAMLRYAGLTCEPVILSTRDHEKAVELLPVLDRFNFTVAELKVGTETYYLDATNRYNPFGVLSRDCYNGFCWRVDKTGHSVFLKPEQLTEKGLISVTTTKADPNDYQMEVRQYFGPLEGARMREEWQKDTTEIRKYVQASVKRLPLDAGLIRYEVKALGDPETGLQLVYQVALKWPGPGNAFYLNPVFLMQYSQNPFKASKRTYPVEMPSAVDYHYSMKLQLPDGYALEEGPKSAIVKIDDDDDYKYMVEYNKDARLLQLSSRIRMKRASFSLEEYDLLQQFFEKITESQQSTCTIKKQS